MRIAHVQPVVVGVVTGGVLAAAASGFSLAPVELTAAVTASTGAVQQCQPLPLSTSSTPTPTPTATPSGSPSPQPSTSDPTASTSATATPTASASKSPTASTDPSPSAHTATPTTSSSASSNASTSAKPSTTTVTAKPSASSTPAATKTSSASATAAKPSATQTQTKTASAASKATTSTTPTSSAATADPAVSSSPVASATSPTAQPGQVSLCVAVQPAKSSIQRGQTALWTVTAWAQGGDVPDATIRLMAAPASLKPTFSFGCGSHDGSTSCDLGALDAKSAQRQLQAKIAVATSATTVTSVRLTATASTAGLTTDPQASATVSVTAASPAATNSADPSAPGGTDVSPLTAGNLPYLPSANPVLSPGGNAAGSVPDAHAIGGSAGGEARPAEDPGSREHVRAPAGGTCHRGSAGRPRGARPGVPARGRQAVVPQAPGSSPERLRVTREARRTVRPAKRAASSQLEDRMVQNLSIAQ